jgi:hypothetical protein
MFSDQTLLILRLSKALTTRLDYLHKVEHMRERVLRLEQAIAEAVKLASPTLQPTFRHAQVRQNQRSLLFADKPGDFRPTFVLRSSAQNREGVDRWSG